MKIEKHRLMGKHADHLDMKDFMHSDSPYLGNYKKQALLKSPDPDTHDFQSAEDDDVSSSPSPIANVRGAANPRGGHGASSSGPCKSPHQDGFDAAPTQSDGPDPSTELERKDMSVLELERA